MTNEATVAVEDQADAPDPLAPDADAPFGYMIDPETQERRPKKRPGRQKVTPPAAAPPPFSSPSADELKATRQPIERTEDRSPDETARRPRGKRSRTRRDGAKDTSSTPPPFRAGPIATGMNKLYAGIGKFVRAWDHDIGTAIIGTTRKESDDDTTVGEAWEELARINPRIRAALLKAIEGGAYQQLIWAHAPIVLAVLMKDSIRRKLPFAKLINSFLTPEPDGTPSDVSAALGGLQGVDVDQMMAMAQNYAANLAMNMTRSGGNAPRGAGDVDGQVVVDAPGDAA